MRRFSLWQVYVDIFSQIHLTTSDFKLAKESLSTIYKKRHCRKTDEFAEAERMLKKGKEIEIRSHWLMIFTIIKICILNLFFIGILIITVFKLLHLIEDIEIISKKDAKTLRPLYEKAGDKAVALESFEFALCAYKNMVGRPLFCICFEEFKPLSACRN